MIGNLAWRVYKSTKEAPESFNNIHMEILSLHALLKEAEETIFRAPIALSRQERLYVIGDGCRNVLIDLETVVSKYESLGTQSKRTWDRMKWGGEDLMQLRVRLTSTVGMLTAFIA